MIDAVILWTDGSDPSIGGKLKSYASAQALESEAVAAPTRFSSNGELQRCVRAIRRFAPFINRIFIVTDGIDPHIEGTTVVDHKVIYRGYEYALPIFCSRAIETLIWRIPGLSERYIYFNDDFILRRPCSESDFFDSDSLICRAHLFSQPLARLAGAVSGRYGYKQTLAESARLMGRRWSFLYTGHLPHPQFRSLFERYYADNEPVMRANASARFRAKGQFNPAALGYYLALREGRCRIVPRRDCELYYKPRKSRSYTERKLAYFDRRKDALAVCFNNLDLAPREDIAAVLEWIDKLLK